MILKRTFHPVGHGAFYTERFYDDMNNNIANVVFDCGRFETAKAKWSEPKYKGWIENYIDNYSGLRVGDTIDILFVSHFHTDHIIGVDHLLKKYNVKKIVLPLISPLHILDSLYLTRRGSNQYNTLVNFYENCLNDNESNKICFVNVAESPDTKVLEMDEFLNSDNLRLISELLLITNGLWYYKPFYQVDTTKEAELIRRLKRKFPDIFVQGNLDRKKLIEKFKAKGAKAFKKIYEAVFGEKKHNSYSLTLFSGIHCHDKCYRKCHISMSSNSADNPRLCSVNCLYMGDYEALNTGLNTLKSFYSYEWGRIGILQVPHHGSEKNSNDDLYSDRERLCIISADSTDKYQHPDQPVLDAIIRNNSVPILVSELPKTKQEYNINF